MTLDQPEESVLPRLFKACEPCKRRKQRCNGRRPCQQCIARGVRVECRDLKLLVSSTRAGPFLFTGSHKPGPLPTSLISNVPSTALSGGWGEDHDGETVAVSNASTPSLFRNTRLLAESAIGCCPFVDYPIEALLVESIANNDRTWVDACSQGAPPKPNNTEARYLSQWYTLSTMCIIDLFDQAEFDDALTSWLGGRPLRRHLGESMVYLVLAIGAQTCPEDKDDLANQYFNYGRYLTMRSMDNPNIGTIQGYILITMYLLGASQRKAAFLNLGLAVRAAHAMMFQQSYTPTEGRSPDSATARRLWKSLRIFDVFISISLGGPMATSQNRDSPFPTTCSTPDDMESIVETILTELNTQSIVSADVFQKICEQNRHWASQFLHNLETERIPATEELEIGGVKFPNIGLYHLKLVYYGAICLLTQPVLLAVAARRVTNSPSILPTQDRFRQLSFSFGSTSPQVLVSACIDSAIRGIEVFRGLLSAHYIPKRLPLIVHLVFFSALTLGIAVFGNLDSIFPVRESLQLACELLRLFCAHDRVSSRYLAIVEHLQCACATHLERRSQDTLCRKRRRTEELFGEVDRSCTPRAVHEDAQSENFPSDGPLFPELRGEETRVEISDSRSCSLGEFSRGEHVFSGFSLNLESEYVAAEIQEPDQLSSYDKSLYLFPDCLPGFM